MFDSELSIVPNQGLGGCELRKPIALIQKELMGLGLYQKGRYEMRGPFEAAYLLEDLHFRISVDVRNGKIFKLCALEGYKGTLFSNLRVGMTVQGALRMDSRIYYDELDEILLFKDCRGISMGVDESGEDPPLGIVLNSRIRAICVYAEEALNANGQSGNW